jgi:RimJ/RimL family protein N-acetyltransferase
MLRGQKVILRPRHEEDVPLLEASLYADVAEFSRASGRPWQPIPPGSPDSMYRMGDGKDDRLAIFSVVDEASGDLAGDCLLWSIDRHNRSTHLGLSLLPGFRGKGLGIDVVRVLCRYAFEILGLHRVQLETLADNEGMIRTAERAGFQLEGRSREAAWVNGEFADEVVYALLVSEWRDLARHA